MTNRQVKCKRCGKLYPSKVEDDYTDYCVDCEELPFLERIGFKLKEQSK